MTLLLFYYRAAVSVELCLVTLGSSYRLFHKQKATKRPQNQDCVSLLACAAARREEATGKLNKIGPEEAMAQLNHGAFGGKVPPVLLHSCSHVEILPVPNPTINILKTHQNAHKDRINICCTSAGLPP